MCVGIRGCSTNGTTMSDSWLSDEQRATLARSIRNSEESWARWSAQVARPFAEAVAARFEASGRELQRVVDAWRLAELRRRGE